MTVTAALVLATGNRLRYLLTHDGSAGNLFTLGNSGAASPDLLTDILTAQAHGAGGPQLKPIVDAGRVGLAQVAAGALTQAQARAFVNSDDVGGAVLVSDMVPRAELKLTQRDGGLPWAADVDVDGANNPEINVDAGGAGASNCYLEVVYVGGPGR